MNYDIIIIAGQSNAEGFGRGPVTEEYIPDDDILYLSGNVSDVTIGEKRVITYPDKTLSISTAKEQWDGGTGRKPFPDFCQRIQG